jgi:uracil-DNA glycosylase
VADGIAFSCSKTGVLQPSLKKWYEGLHADIYSGTSIAILEDPDLSYLGKEGVLMLNSSLTVSKGKIGSHKGIWDPFMHFLIEQVLNDFNPGLVYILMGKEAERWEEFISPWNAYVLKCEHPAAAARDRRKWNYEQVFSKCDEILRNNNGTGIIWDSLPF